MAAFFVLCRLQRFWQAGAGNTGDYIIVATYFLKKRCYLNFLSTEIFEKIFRDCTLLAAANCLC